MNTPTKLYRFENRCDFVLLETYAVVRATPCGVWVKLPYEDKLKFVPNADGKRFAWPTEDEARTSFFRRKARQLKILRAQITNIEAAVERMEAGEIGERYTSFDL